jgi:hypothetical protein
MDVLSLSREQIRDGSSKEHGEGCPGAAIEGLGAQVLERAPRPSSAELRKVMLLNTFTT